MAITFEDVWRKVRLYVPSAPVFLVQTWVNNGWRTLSDRRMWSWRIVEGQITWDDARTVTATVTLGSATVTSTPGDFLAADVGRQFRVGTYPIFTIIARVDAFSVTLDRPYQSPSFGTDLTAQIVDAYATMPIDFSQFLTLVDPVYQRRIPWWATWDEMDLIDPTRTATSSVPQLLGARKLSSLPATLGQVQYQLWPIPTAKGALQTYYINRPVALTNDFVFAGVLGTRSDVLEAWALSEAARWPGTTEVKNPYFNLNLATSLDARFEQLATQLDLRDDDEYQQSYDKIPWQRWSAWAWAYNTHLLQATDATVGDYAGMGTFSSDWWW